MCILAQFFDGFILSQRNKASCMICFNISILHPDLIWMISKLYESDWTCTRRFSDGFVTISSEGIYVKGRNFWKRFQHSFNIASTIILVINNRVMTWLQLNPRRWFMNVDNTTDKLLACISHRWTLFSRGKCCSTVSKRYFDIKRNEEDASSSKKLGRSESQAYPRTKSPFPPSRDALRHGDRLSCANSKHGVRASRTEVEWWCFEEGSPRSHPSRPVRLSFGRSILVDELGG